MGMEMQGASEEMVFVAVNKHLCLALAYEGANLVADAASAVV